MAARDLRETERLIEALRRLNESQIAAVRILISYRADLEGRLGEIWQRISGSPEGLPRMYVAGIDVDSAISGIKQTVKDLKVSVKFTPEETAGLKKDLLIASEAANFEQAYPPYVQILIDHVWSTAATAGGQYAMSDYAAAGGISGIIGTYLGRLLNYAKDSKGEIQAVLVTLVRSYGAKRQATLHDIAAETNRDEALCEKTLEKLIDLRLVRHIGDYYEIAHDFLARKVLFELVDSDELTFKRFRDLLASKAAAFSMTRSLLSDTPTTRYAVFSELGEAYFYLGDIDLANQYFAHAVKEELSVPESSRTAHRRSHLRYWRAYAAYAQGDFNTAKRELAAAAAIAPAENAHLIKSIHTLRALLELWPRA